MAATRGGGSDPTMRSWSGRATLIGTALALCLALTATTARAQSDGGDGGVLADQTGTRGDVALDDATRAAAAEALGGRSIAIVLPVGMTGTLPEDAPEAQGAKAAIEALGATPVSCDTLELRRRAARCGGANVDAVVVFQLDPVDTFGGRSGAQADRLIERGLHVVVVDFSDGASTPAGSVRLTIDDTAIGLEQGRAAGAWAAQAWPDLDPTVAISPRTEGPDPYYDAVVQGLSETLPAATITPPSFDQLSSIDANLYTGWLFMDPSLQAALAAGLVGIEDQPSAFFPITCPDPLPTGPEFAGCLRYGNEEVGVAAVDVIATLVTGGQVAAEIAAGPTIEVVTPG
jgi:hypothetical protein